MTTQTMLFLILAIYLLVPIALYRLPHKKMATFCCYMACGEVARKFYCIILLIAVIYLHFIYYNGHRGENGVMVSSLLMLPLFSHKFTDSIHRMLADNNYRLWLFAIMTMAIAFIPQMFTFAVTMAMLIVAASFYPSWDIRTMSNTNVIFLYNKAVQANDYNYFVQLYFR